MEGEKSDIDLLVVGDIAEDKLLKAVNEVERRTGREVNYNLWTDGELGEKVRDQIPLIREIGKTPVMMVIGEENEFKRVIEKRTG